MSNDNCGRKYKCGRCGNEVHFGDTFCSACGMKLNWPTTAPSPLQENDEAIKNERAVAAPLTSSASQVETDYLPPKESEGNPSPFANASGNGSASKEQYARYSKGFLQSFVFNIVSSAFLFVGALLAFFLPIFKIVIKNCDSTSGSCVPWSGFISPLMVFLNFEQLGNAISSPYTSSGYHIGYWYSILFSLDLVIALIAAAVALGLNIYKAAKIQETSLFLFDSVKKGTKDRRDIYSNPMGVVICIFAFIITQYVMLYITGMTDAFGFTLAISAPIVFFVVSLVLSIISTVKKNTIKKMILSEDYHLKKEG
jgi:hypothetical protein